MDEFEYKGHYCMVMPLLGDSMYMVLKDNEYKPVPDESGFATFFAKFDPCLMDHP